MNSGIKFKNEAEINKDGVINKENLMKINSNKKELQHENFSKNLRLNNVKNDSNLQSRVKQSELNLLNDFDCYMKVCEITLSNNTNENIKSKIPLKENGNKMNNKNDEIYPNLSNGKLINENESQTPTDNINSNIACLNGISIVSSDCENLNSNLNTNFNFLSNNYNSNFQKNSKINSPLHNMVKAPNNCSPIESQTQLDFEICEDENKMDIEIHNNSNKIVEFNSTAINNKNNIHHSNPEDSNNCFPNDYLSEKNKYNTEIEVNPFVNTIHKTSDNIESSLTNIRANGLNQNDLKLQAFQSNNSQENMSLEPDSNRNYVINKNIPKNNPISTKAPLNPINSNCRVLQKRRPSNANLANEETNRNRASITNKNLKSNQNKQIVKNPSHFQKFIPILQKYQNCIPLDYIPDIWHSLKSSENSLACMPKFQLILQQEDINFDMRAILIDWIIDVHKNYKMFPETLYICISIIDRFLSKKQVQRGKLQLLGTTALYISSKYEEIIFPCIEEFIKVTDDAYNKEEVLKMEDEIFQQLEFDLTYPSAYRFFEIISLNYNFSEVEFFYGCYLLEYFLISPSSSKYLPSVIALAVVLVILKIKKYENYRDLYKLIDSVEGQRLVKECAGEIYDFPFKCKNINLFSVFNKYSSPQFHCVAVNDMENDQYYVDTKENGAISNRNENW